jgi:hypothetical protein
MATTPEEAEELKKQLDDLRKILVSLDIDFDKIAGRLRPIKEDQKAINDLYNTFNNRLKSASTETDYLVSNFQRLVGEVKNTSAGTQQTVLAFKNLSSIAQQLSSHQAGYNRMSTQEIEKLQVKAKIESDRLFRAKTLLEEELAYSKVAAKQLELQKERYQEQLKSNANNQQAKEALKDVEKQLQKQLSTTDSLANKYETVNNLLHQEDISLKELTKSLERSVDLSKQFDKVMGLTGATAEGLKTAFNNLGLGKLGETLGLDKALKAAQEKADELLQSKIQNEKIIKDLSEQNLGLEKNIEENLKKQLETQESINKLKSNFPDIVNQLEKEAKLEKEIKDLNTQNLSIEDIREGKGGDALKRQQLKLDFLKSQNVQEKEQFKSEEDKLKFLNKQISAQKESLDVNKKQIKESQEALKNQSLLNQRTQVLNTYIKDLGSNLVKNLKDPLFIVGFLVKEIVSAFKMIDAKTGELAKNMNLSYSAAAGVANQANIIANKSNTIGVTTKGIMDSYQAIGKQLGTNAILNEKDAVAMAKFRDIAGVSQETLSKLQVLTSATGGNLEKNVSTMMASAKITGNQLGVALNEREVLDDISKLSKATLASYAGMPNKLGEAVATAKSLGMTMEQLDKTASHLLQFEDSIGAELEAELLTGKNINLERARLAALNNDQVTLAKEIRKQYGDINEFSKMNRLQQEAIAKSVGMSREELAATLVQEQALKTMSKDQSEAAKRAFEARVKAVGLEKAQEEVRKGQLKDMMNSQSAQERFNQTIEKLKEVFVSLVTPLLPVLDIFMLILKPIGMIAGLLGRFSNFLSPVIGLMLTWKLLTGSIGKGIGGILKSMFSIFTTQGRINIAKKLGFITDQQANRVQYANNMLQKDYIVSEKAKNLAKKSSLGYVIKENIQKGIGAAKDKIALASEQFRASAKLRTAAAENAVGKASMLTRLKSLPGMLIDVGKWALKAASAVAGIPIIGPILAFGAAAAAIAGGMALYNKFKGSDVFSPAQGGGGYGKRTLLAPEGAIELNNNDNVVATTNDISFKKGDDVKSMVGKPTEIKSAGSVEPKIFKSQESTKPTKYQESIKPTESKSEKSPTTTISIDYNAIGAAVAAALKGAPLTVHSTLKLNEKVLSDNVINTLGKESTKAGDAQRTNASKV